MSRNIYRSLLTLLAVLQAYTLLEIYYLARPSFPYGLNEAYGEYIYYWLTGNPWMRVYTDGALIGVATLYFIATVGAWLFFRWGRYLFGIAVALGYSLLLLTPDVHLLFTWDLVETVIIAMLEGALLVAMWSPPLGVEFRNVRKEAL